MPEYPRALVREAILFLEAALDRLGDGDLYAHTQISEALSALRMLDVGEGTAPPVDALAD